MGTLVRKNVCLDSYLIDQVERIAKAKGGARMGASFSAEVTIALKEYVQRRTMQQEEVVLAPVLERLLDEKFERLEQCYARAPGVAPPTVAPLLSSSWSYCAARPWSPRMQRITLS